MIRRISITRILLSASALLLAAGVCLAEEERPKHEIAVYGGLTRFSMSEAEFGTRPTVGFGYGVRVKERLAVGFDFSGAPGQVSGTGIGWNGRPFRWERDSITGQLNFNVHVLAGPAEARVVPYFVAGGGGATLTVGEEAGRNFGMHAGFGTRIYCGKRWGVRPEFLVGRYSEGLTAIRAGAGIFFQFGK